MGIRTKILLGLAAAVLSILIFVRAGVYAPQVQSLPVPAAKEVPFLEFEPAFPDGWTIAEAAIGVTENDPYTAFYDGTGKSIGFIYYANSERTGMFFPGTLRGGEMRAGNDGTHLYVNIFEAEAGFREAFLLLEGGSLSKAYLIHLPDLLPEDADRVTDVVTKALLESKH